MMWARIYDGTHDKGTNHHPNCPKVDESLIDVWHIECEHGSYYLDYEPRPEDLEDDQIAVKGRMHRELYDRLPEFSGF